MISRSEIPSVTGLRSKADRAIGFRDAVQRSLDATTKEVKRLEGEDEILTLTSKLLRTLMDMQVTEAKKVVETLLTEGLQNVFVDQNLRVRADVEESRGKVAMNLVTIEHHADGKVTEGVADEANGGAVTTVQSVLMRIITTMKRGQRRILALDESLPAFDDDYVIEMMRFLQQICTRLGFDIVMVTQNKSLTAYANRAYDLHKSDGRASIKRIQ